MLLPQGRITVLSSLLTLLGERPTPDSVAAQIVQGFREDFSAHASVVLVREDDKLRRIGSHGYSESDLAGFVYLPLDADLPLCQAVRDAELVIGSGASTAQEYSGLAAEPERWDRFRAERRLGAVVSVPIVAAGTVIGVFGFTCDEDRTWGPRDIAIVEAVADALTLWLMHPDAGHGTVELQQGDTAALSRRQRQMLALVLQGRSTPGIGAALGYSSSTVKQDLKRAMQVLGVTSRTAAATRAQELGLLDPTGGLP